MKVRMSSVSSSFGSGLLAGLLRALRLDASVPYTQGIVDEDGLKIRNGCLQFYFTRGVLVEAHLPSVTVGVDNLDFVHDHGVHSMLASVLP